MEQQIMRTHHDDFCHLGVTKCYEMLKKTYWFPEMMGKIKLNIDNCLKCLYFSPNSGIPDGILHKGNATLLITHVDHYSPLPPPHQRNIYLQLLMVSLNL